MSKERLQVLSKIDALQAKHCETCSDNPRGGGHTNKVCRACPIGAQIMELGEKLNGSIRQRKERNAMAGVKGQKQVAAPKRIKTEKTVAPKVANESEAKAEQQEVADLQAAAQHWREVAERGQAEIDRLIDAANQYYLIADGFRRVLGAPTVDDEGIEAGRQKIEDMKHNERVVEAGIKERDREIARLRAQLDVAAGYAEGVPSDPNSTYQALVDFGELPKRKHDSVNHPSHYTAGAVECIDAIEAATIGLTGGKAYATGAAIKYLWRWSMKNGVEDLRKASWYIDRLIGEVDAG